MPELVSMRYGGEAICYPAVEGHTMTSPLISQEFYDQLVKLVRTFPERAGALLDDAGGVPAPGSRIDRELGGLPAPGPLETSLSLGAQALEHAADHLFALSDACVSPDTPFPAFTLARGVLESSATALWILDADIEGKERVERGMSLRLAGLEDQKKLLRASPPGPDADEVTRKIASRIKDIMTVAGARGVEPHRNRRMKIDGFGSKMPGRLELVSRIPGGEFDYRLLSAVTHGHSWSLIGVAFKPSGKQNMAVKAPEPIVFVYVCWRAIEFFARALWAQVYLHGWKSGPFARLLEETYDSIGLIPEGRFWRSQAVVHM
ncbi:MAG: hypothetical protein F4Z77_03395 [Dehalococcoidia bacterium]|nr:hypothetical protein [Dehalococcoidia bacterium]MYA51936.1 hypothetical protein [Dehalococcoidia bacterium]